MKMDTQRLTYQQIPQADRLAYQKQFLDLRSRDGYVDGKTALEFFSRNSLPRDELAKMWEHADLNKDGRLDVTEFCTAMHIVKTMCRQLHGAFEGLLPTPPKPRSITPTPAATKEFHFTDHRRYSAIEVSQKMNSQLPSSSSDFRTAVNGYAPAAPPYTLNLDDLRQLTSDSLSVFTPRLPLQSGPAPRLPSQSGLAPRLLLQNAPVKCWPAAKSDVRRQTEFEQKIRERQELVRQRDLARRDLERYSAEYVRLSDLISKKSADLSRQRGASRKPSFRDDNISKEATLKSACAALEAERCELEDQLIAAAQERSRLQAKKPVLVPDIKLLDKEISEKQAKTAALKEKLNSEWRQGSTLRDGITARNSRLASLKHACSDLSDEHQRLLHDFRDKQRLVVDPGEPEELFPVPKVTQRKPSIKDSVFVAVADYCGESADELSFSENDVVKVLEKSVDGWWLGRDTRNREGYFPAAYVRPVGSAADPEPEPDVVKENEYAVALYAYAALNSDELSFNLDDVVEMLPKEGLDDGWLFGKVVGLSQTGLVPSNYLQMQGSKERNGSIDRIETPAVDLIDPSENRQRENAVRELVKTEESYLNDMKAVLDVFGVALRTVCTMEEHTNDSDGEDVFGTKSDIRPAEAECREVFSWFVRSWRGMFGRHDMGGEDFSKFPRVGSDKVRILDCRMRFRLFTCWQDIIACASDLVHAFDVRSRQSPGGILEGIGEILCRHLPPPPPYVKFCSGQMKIGELIQAKTSNNAQFAEMLSKCSEDPRIGKMPLAASYVKPMQRVTKYPLLIKRIIETTPRNHNDFPNLNEALKKAQVLCEQVNEGVRVKELTDRFEWIQQHVLLDAISAELSFNSKTNFMGPRQLLYSGSLVKLKTGRELVAFLFNDFLLLTTPPKPSIGAFGNFSFEKRQWTSNTLLRVYKKPLLLSGCKVTALPEEACFQISFGSAVVLLFKVTSVVECKAWMKNLEKASVAYETVEKKHRLPSNRSVASSSPVGFCRLIVEGATELDFSSSKGRCDPFCTVSMGTQEFRTAVAENSSAPKWDFSASFAVLDLEKDVLSLSVFDYNPFAPNGFLGNAELRMKHLYSEAKNLKVPLVKKVLLYAVESGEVVLRIDIKLVQVTK